MSDKKDFARFVLSTISNTTSNKEQAISFLKEEGVNVEKFVSEGIQKIKRMQMEIAAAKTEQEMNALTIATQKAIAFVETVMNSFTSPRDMIQRHQMKASFRNVESLSREDVQQLLIKHYTLKFSEEENKDQ